MATGKNIAFKFINSRKVSFAKLAADLAIGFTANDGKFVGLFVVPDFLLKESPTKGYYFTGPSKPYLKDGVHQVDDNGYKRYLEFFKLYTEKGANSAEPDKYAATKPAFEARKHIIGLLVKELESLGDSGSSQAAAPRAATRQVAPARATRPTQAKQAIEEIEVAVPGGEDDDDDMPF